ncbi:MAG: hypothetical protein AAF581_22930, partial [Planctomycetota bacterium]
MTQWIQNRSVGQLLSYVGIAFVLLAIGVFYVVQVTAPRSARATITATDPILEIDNGTLTTFTGSTFALHDIDPLALQRGVDIDGTLRRSRPGLVPNGNPFSHAHLGSPKVGSVDLATGNFLINDIDLALPSKGPVWVIGRTYNHVQDAGSGHVDSNGVQGFNWHQTSMPEIQLAGDVLYILYGAGAFLEFKEDPDNDQYYDAVNGASGVVVFTAESGNESEYYTWYDQRGTQTYFYGWSESGWGCNGQIWKIEDDAGNVAYVGDKTSNHTAYTSANGYDNGDRYEKAFDTEGREYDYKYLTVGGIERLRQVIVTEASTEVARVTYNYLSSGAADTDIGSPGDLRQVAVLHQLPSGTNNKRTYYRYYTADTPDTGDGDDHLLKFVLDAEAVRRYEVHDNPNVNLDHFTATESELERFISTHLKYDSSSRVKEAKFSASCGCGSSAGTYKYTYGTSGYNNDAGYDQEWATRTVVERPDTTFVTQYFDEVGQRLSYVLTDGDPTGAVDTWVHHVERDEAGIVTEIHTPANATGYTHSTGAITTATASGKITTFDLEGSSSAATKGFATARRWQEGTSGSRYLDEKWSYTTGTIDVGDGRHVARPMLRQRDVYADETTNSASSTSTYDYSWTFPTGSLVPEKLVTTLADVATANNGSGSGNTTSTHFNAQGRKDYDKSATGIITYYEYDRGQLKKVIEDADPTSPPSGFDSDGSGDELHRITTHTYDKQGRRTETVHPDGRKEQTYYSYLSPGSVNGTRLDVVLSYTDFSAPDTYYGPVTVRVINHAGRIEAQGTLGLDNGGTLDETDVDQVDHIVETGSDLLAALASFTEADLTALSTTEYDESGSQVEDQRVYSNIPSTLPGVNGTDFVQSSFEYDSMGRTTKRTDRQGTSHATIYETEYDGIGRFWKSKIGTPTGNIVDVELVEYDSTNDGGNSFVTKRSLRVEDDSTNERVTTYDYDVHGNVEREVRPEAPYYVHKYDNQMRRIATGQYSSSPTLPLDPAATGTQTNRVALQETAYDELGRAWKRTRHKVKQSDGDRTDTLTSETWYDKDGRVAKVDGEQLVKYGYDRIGRRTHTYVLASDNDTNYATSIDDTSANADGDVVLEERQQIYADDSNELVLTAVIERAHTETTHTGALDSNADGDPLKYTLTATPPAEPDVEGRIQIRASWYDFLGRTTTSVEYGTNGGDTFTRTVNAPTSGTDILITTYDYAISGLLETTTDPMGIEYYREYDASGQVTKTIDDKDDGSGPAEIARTTEYTYTNGLRTLMRNKLPASNQDTVYTYGTSTGSGATDSEIATGHLLSEIQYPDHDSQATPNDVVTLAYNTQQELIAREDQAGNLIDVTYDLSGRASARKATNVATGFDDSVERIEYAYNARGLLEAVTQYDAPSLGNVVDDVEYTYGDWGMLTTIEQDHNSGVGDSG